MNENNTNNIDKSTSSAGKGIMGVIFAITSFFAGFWVAVLVVVLVLFLVIVSAFSTVPLGIIDADADKIHQSEVQLAERLQSKYNKAQSNAKINAVIIDYIRNHYEPNASYSNLSYRTVGTGKVYSYNSDTVQINIYYKNTLTDMASEINAYVIAVNGAISYYDVESVLEEQDGIVDYIDSGFTLFKAAFRDCTIAKYFDDLEVASSDCFVADVDTSRWYVNVKKYVEKREIVNNSNNDIHEEKVATGRQTNRVVLPIEPEPDPEPVPDEPGPIYEEVITYKGSITIPMYYDLSTFKADTLEEIIKDYADEEDFRSDLALSLNAFYESYFLIGEIEDNRENVFAPLLNDGSMMYVPISGLSESFSFDLKGTTGFVTVNELKGKSNTEIWQIITALRNNHTLSQYATNYQCTAFANYWFYLVYKDKLPNAGYWLRGNGNQMADLLVRDHPDKFYLSTSPQAGAICSIGSTYSSRVNHVLCVDAVDYERKIIVISEGNVFSAKGCKGTSKAGVRIQKELTFAQFEAYTKQLAKDMCGSSSGVWVKFANPYE